MFTWFLAFILQEIIDNYVASQHRDASEIQDARNLLHDYWSGRDEPDKSRLHVGRLVDAREQFGGRK